MKALTLLSICALLSVCWSMGGKDKLLLMLWSWESFSTFLGAMWAPTVRLTYAIVCFHQRWNPRLSWTPMPTQLLMLHLLTLPLLIPPPLPTPLPPLSPIPPHLTLPQTLQHPIHHPQSPLNPLSPHSLQSPLNLPSPLSPTPLHQTLALTLLHHHRHPHLPQSQPVLRVGSRFVW